MWPEDGAILGNRESGKRVSPWSSWDVLYKGNGFSHKQWLKKSCSHRCVQELQSDSIWGPDPKPSGKILIDSVSLSGRDMVSKVPDVSRSTCTPCREHQLSLQVDTAWAGVCPWYCQPLGSEKRSVDTKHFPCVYRYLNQSVTEIQSSFFFFFTSVLNQHLALPRIWTYLWSCIFSQCSGLLLAC